MKPMMWMGRLSAWLALPMGALLAANAAIQLAEGGPGWLQALAAVLLLLAAFRTLRRLSGGLRLLAGAWGLAAGMLAWPLLQQTPGTAFDTGGAVLVAVSLACLALTVLHKEK